MGAELARERRRPSSPGRRPPNRGRRSRARSPRRRSPAARRSRSSSISFPSKDANQTRLSPFFDQLQAGRLTTTQCRRDGQLSWPPRVVCPKCHTSDLDWVDLPRDGRVYAFSAVLVGAPLGMEAEVPFVVGLVELEGVPFRLFGRIVGTSWEPCHVGQTVRAEPYDLGDGRVFYRFRVVG